MINIAEIISDPDFMQEYTVRRNVGVWVDGRFVETPTNLAFHGVIVPANAQDVQMLPEGDRVSGLINFYTTSDNPFQISRADNGALGTSDQPIWRGNNFRILQVFDYQDYGYQLAIGTRMDGR